MPSASLRTVTHTLAWGLGIAVVAACSEGTATGLERIFGDDPSTILIVNDNDTTTGQCVLAGQVLKAANGKTSSSDLNGDGYVCVSTDRGKKH